MNIKKQLRIESNNLPDVKERLKRELNIPEKQKEKKRVKWGYILSPIMAAVVIAIVLTVIFVPNWGKSGDNQNIAGVIERNYGMAVLSAINVAHLGGEAGTVAVTPEQEEYAKNVDAYLNMLNGYMKNNVTVDKTFLKDGYNKALKIKKDKEVYYLYYNETLSDDEEADSDDERETKIDGIIAIGKMSYKVEGDKEVENSGGEIEVSIDLKLYLSETKFVEVKHSIEEEPFENETEFECKTYDDEKLIERTLISTSKEFDEIQVNVTIKKEDREFEYNLVREGNVSSIKVSVDGEEKIDGEVEFLENGNKYTFEDNEFFIEK